MQFTLHYITMLLQLQAEQIKGVVAGEEKMATSLESHQMQNLNYLQSIEKVGRRRKNIQSAWIFLHRLQLVNDLRSIEKVEEKKRIRSAWKCLHRLQLVNDL